MPSRIEVMGHRPETPGEQRHPVSDRESALDRNLNSFRLKDRPFEQEVMLDGDRKKEIAELRKKTVEELSALKEKASQLPLTRDEVEHARNLSIAVERMDRALEDMGTAGESINTGVKVAQSSAVGFGTTTGLSTLLGTAGLAIPAVVAGSIGAGALAWWLPEKIGQWSKRVPLVNKLNPGTWKLGARLGMLAGVAAIPGIGMSVLPIAATVGGIMGATYLANRLKAQQEAKEEAARSAATVPAGVQGQSTRRGADEPRHSMAA